MDADAIARLRSIPLETVLESFGAQRDPKDRHNWLIGGSRIVVTGEKFADQHLAGATHRLKTEKGGGGAIDLTQYLGNLSFMDAVRRLGGVDAVQIAAKRQAIAAVTIAKKVDEETPPPVPDPTRIARVRWYLTEVRAIPANIVDVAIRSGRVFAESRGDRVNAVFRLTDAANRDAGFSIRGTHPEKSYHQTLAPKGVYSIHANEEKLVTFVESAIDAMSFKALGKSGLAISVTGTSIKIPTEAGQELVKRGYQLVMGFDADNGGDDLSKNLSKSLGGTFRRDRPDLNIGKDWNQLLVAQRDRGRQDLLESQRKEISSSHDVMAMAR